MRPDSISERTDPVILHSENTQNAGMGENFYFRTLPVVLDLQSSTNFPFCSFGFAIQTQLLL
jgi:hypothetical protein